MNKTVKKKKSNSIIKYVKIDPNWKWHFRCVTIVTHLCHNCGMGVSQLWHGCVTIVTWVCHNCDMGVSQLWHGGVTIVSWVSQLWHTYVNPEILVLISDDWQYKSTNTTVKKKKSNSIIKYVRIDLNWKWPIRCVTIVTWVCHNCVTGVSQLWHGNAFSIQVNFNILNDGIWFFFLHSFIHRHIL